MQTIETEEQAPAATATEEIEQSEPIPFRRRPRRSPRYTAADEPEPETVSLGSEIRRRRREANMSQEELAVPQFTKSYISAIERDKVNPSMKALRILATRLNTNPAELLSAAGNEFDSDSPATFHRWLGEWVINFETAHVALLALNRTEGRLLDLHSDRPDFSDVLNEGNELDSPEWFGWYGEVLTRSRQVAAATEARDQAVTRLNKLEQGRADWLSYLPQRYQELRAADVGKGEQDNVGTEG